MSKKLEDMLKGLTKEVSGFKSKDEWATDTINEQILAMDDPSQISDGAHTFDELYYHRMILFSMVCNQNRHYAWKSKLHDNGSMIDGMFIVGIETPEGQVTYHYPLEFWDNFKVNRVKVAPVWDGHTSEDIDRLISLL